MAVVAVGGLLGSLPAQAPPQTIAFPYPAAAVLPTGTLPAAALQADLQNPTWGYPTTHSPCGNCAWPVTASMGDIDNDGELDVLLCMEQRLLLALGFVRDPSGKPTSSYLIWAWFDPTTKVFKHGWSKDSACIGDFDGDGLNEVAALVGPGGAGSQLPCFLAGGTQDSYRVAILGGATSPDPQFGDLPRPSVLADWAINSAPHGGWTCSLLHGTNGNNVDLRVVHMSPNPDPSDPTPREIMISDQGARRLAVLRYDGAGGLSNTFDFVPPWPGPGDVGTHTTRIADLDGDGFDDALNNGVIDFVNGCSWDPWTLTFFSGCSNQYNHIDAIQPWDHDGDGDLELACVHDCYDFLLEGASSGCSAVPIWPGGENVQAPALHGQAICIGEFVAGADVFGWTAREALITPKGVPGTAGITGGANWSYVYNGNSWEMAFCYPPGGPAGPRDFDARNFDWDGDRTTDEIYARYASTHEVWRVVANPAYTGPTTQDPTPVPFPTSAPWPSYPYEFQLVASFDSSIWTGTGSCLTADLFGDYREEIVTTGRQGIEIAYNPAVLANPIQHPSPWTDAGYLRRQQGDPSDTVDYQQLGALKAVEVVPAVTAVDVGGQVNYRAYAVYTNGERVDVTGRASFTAGPHGSFTGAAFTATGYGICSVQATVYGVASTNAALVRVTDDSRPAIVYAGYSDSYLTASAASDLTLEVGVADREGDVGFVGFAIGGVPLPGAARDDGLAGDRVAGDGIWTLEISGVQFPVQDFAPPASSYVEAYVADFAGNLSDVWPYLRVGVGGAPVVGVPVSPFDSESLTSGPPVQLAGTGVLPGTAPVAGGAVTLFARALPGAAPDSVLVYAASVLVPVNLNDAGVGADQLAGDGLWTASTTWGSLPDGDYVIEFVAVRSSPSGVSDAYPRLRSHH